MAVNDAVLHGTCVW